MNQFPQPPAYPGAPPPNEGLATTALVLGILSIICLGPFAGIPAIICGHIARGRIARSGGTLGGGGPALAGLLLGYASLFLIVVGGLIFARVVAKQAPMIQSKIAKPAVTAQHARLVDALIAYKADFGQFPAISPSSGEQVDTKGLVGILGGNNKNGRKYYDASGSGIQINGIPADPWGETLNMAIDLDGDGVVKVGKTDVPGVCAIWSSGPNETNDDGTGDDVTSW